VILELARSHDIPVQIKAIRQEEALTADEIWLTSSSKEVLAVTHVDASPIGNGMPGSLFKHMHQLYQTFKQKLMQQKS
jgi:D-alanine transaminase